MATGTKPMADTRNDPEVDVASPMRTIPIVSPTTSSPLQPLAIHQSRIAEHAAIARAEGHASQFLEVDDEDEDDDDEDGFVAVGHDDVEDSSWYFRQPTSGRSKLDDLYPFVQLLSTADADNCVRVEAAFPEHERCSKEKILYRLTKCPELSLGVFSRPRTPPNQEIPPAILVAHILATRTPALTVTDASMGLPENWRNKRSAVSGEVDVELLGHQDQGSTIAIHSLAVLPEHQGKGVGRTLLRAYIQRIKDAEIADRIALLSHEHLIPFYTSLGFVNRGPSQCTFGGGGWYSLILELK